MQTLYTPNWASIRTFLIMFTLIALFILNPGFQEMKAHLNYKRYAELKQSDNVIVEIADWIGEFEVCRRNCLFFSFFTISYQSIFLTEPTEAQLYVGIADHIMLVDTRSLKKMSWLRSNQCTYIDF
ncbi:MAG: hypothetical protein AAF798_07010 [Bacteroidota bacterium]